LCKYPPWCCHAAADDDDDDDDEDVSSCNDEDDEDVDDDDDDAAIGVPDEILFWCWIASATAVEMGENPWCCKTAAAASAEGGTGSLRCCDGSSPE